MEEQKPVEPTVNPEETPKVSIDDLASQLEQIKKAQAGSDKAYQEAAKKAAALEAENEQLKKEKMSEKERAEFELAKQRAEIEKKGREVAEATLRLSTVRLMGEKGVPLEYSEYIHGTNEEEIAQSINTFNARLEKLVAERVQKTLTGNEKPKAGAPPTDKPDTTKLSFKELEDLARAGKL